MRKIVLAALTCMMYVSVMLGQTVNPDYADGRIYFKLKSDVPLYLSFKGDNRIVDIKAYSFLSAIAEKYNLEQLLRPFFAAKESDILQRTFELQFTDIQNVDYIVRDLQALSVIEYAEKVPLHKYMVTPNDPSYPSQWELAKISASTAWNYSTGSSTVKVAIDDSGVETTHPDLSANIWTNTGEIAGNSIDDDANGYVDDVKGWDVADWDNNPDPTNSGNHGTMVAGCASARSNNSVGIASIGYSVKIIAIKASKTTAGTMPYGYDGIIYAAAAKANVINLSWGGTVSSTTGQNVINYAYGKGCLIVAAAGNAGNSTLEYPAAYTNVIAVASTGSGDKKSSWSSYGSYIDVCAPGEGIYTTNVGSGYTTTQGTSFSSPIVSGLCGLMLSLYPYLTLAEIETCLKSNTDDISALNPSYTGQLGTGRVNAFKTMQCVDAKVASKPTTDFVANFTTVTAGGNVTFTDLSIHNPTTWNWTFTGGTPASFVGKTPPQIAYNTPGTYDVTLVTSNGNGNDTKLKTGYITVTASTGCDIVNYSNLTGGLWHGVYYSADVKTPSDSGYIVGLNYDNDTQKAQFFDATAYPNTKLTRAFIRANKAYSATTTKIITINVYDAAGPGGAPGALLGSTTKTIQQFRTAALANKYVEVAFKPVINLPVNKKFFISIDYSTLNWKTDTLSFVSNTHGETNPSAIWEQRGGGWGQMGVTAGTWGLKASMYIFPYLTNQPVIATSTVSPLTICEGDVVNVNATGSTYQDTLLWFTPGGNPSISNNISQGILYNTAGTYIAKLYVVGGGCHELDSTVATVTVNATPNINVTSTNGAVLCPGNTTTLTASGAAGSYTWTPATNLSTTTGATVVASPTADITYNVSGTTAGCVGSSAFSITIDKPISVSVTTTPSSVSSLCTNTPAQFDATPSTNVSTYTWSFVGGTPSSSNLATPIVKYASFGTYTVTLTATNSCGSDNSYSKVITVGCVGLNELFSSANIATNYNPLYKQLNIAVNDNSNMGDKLTVKIIDLLGQVVYAGQMALASDRTSTVVDMSAYAKGVYTVQLSGNEGVYNSKFVAE